jgi:hypothetical protein
MKLFKCQSCHQPIYFENRVCGNCGHKLGYLPVKGQLTALAPAGDVFTALVDKRQRVRYCANIADDACNWLIPADAPDEYCLACRHNRTIPDITVPENLARWQKMEIAKHRLFYTLIALRLPLKNINDDPEHGLTFDFLAEDPSTDVKILTGHDDGLITINLNEADDALREKLRTSMGEPYRTLLGHFRHEVGHYFWDVLVRDAGKLDECRAIFGDDRQDYGEALKRHYAEGPPVDWQENFISSYATAHPWEDFAETWAHYLHIVDTLETASAFGLRIHPVETKNRALHADIDFNPHHATSVKPLMDAWLPLTFAVNSLNRSMGHPDLYPFIVSQPVVKKLQFIQDIIRAGAVAPKKTAPRKRNIFSRMMNGTTPDQPPAPPSSPPGPPAPGPNVPPSPPPIVEPPADPVMPPETPPEVPPGGPTEIPVPLHVG